jgi:hypothetical protein
MMAWHAGHAVASAGDGHLGRLECGVVSRGEAAILRERRNCSIGKIARNKAADFSQLLAGGRVPVDLIVQKKFLPTH